MLFQSCFSKLLYEKSTGCPREPYPLGCWLTTFILWTYMGLNMWQMKSELIREKISTHSLPEA